MMNVKDRIEIQISGKFNCNYNRMEHKSYRKVETEELIIINNVVSQES